MQTIDAAEAPVHPQRRFALERFAFWITAATVVALDQITKAIVRSTMEIGERWPSGDWPVYFRHVTNTGAAFGSLQNATTLLIVMTFIGLAAIYLYYRNPPFQHWIASIAIGLMLGGAVGNLIDRVRVRRVVDFVHFPHFPNFNVADASINLGVAILIIGYLLFGAKKAQPDETDEDAPADG